MIKASYLYHSILKFLFAFWCHPPYLIVITYMQSFVNLIYDRKPGSEFINANLNFIKETNLIQNVTFPTTGIKILIRCLITSWHHVMLVRNPHIHLDKSRFTDHAAELS